MRGGMVTSPAVQAKAINQPIVNVLNQILGVVSRGTLGGARAGQEGAATYGKYQEARKEVARYAYEGGKSGKGTVQELFGKFGGLDAKQVQGVIKSNPGVASVMMQLLDN